MVIRKRPFFPLLFALFILFAIPHLFVIVGDAQVHLAVAENFANGRSFQYNPNGELVVASTSPFWTLLLTLFYTLVGDYAPLLLKLTVVCVWCATAVLLHRIGRDRWQLSPNGQIALLALWLGHTTLVANALGGLENILSALQLVWLYYLVTAPEDEPLPWRKVVSLGLLIGWAVLTRPDGGIFLVALFGCYCLALVATSETLSTIFGRLLPRFVAVGLIAILVVTPWYLYQYQVMGQLVTDSSVARLYNGRLGSLILIPNRLYLHPKALISLATAFLPLSVGMLVYVGMLVRNAFSTVKGNENVTRVATRATNASLGQGFAGITAVFIFIVGLLFYTFVVGAESFGRYFLPLYPFLFLTGIVGLQQIYGFLHTYRPTIATLFAALTILFFASTSLLDNYRRLIPGRFTVNQPLDVIYGPAHQQYTSFNLFDLVNAPGARQTFTYTLIQDVSGETPARIAVTEVQLRYFLDEQVEVISLDGRTSAAILTYTDPATGIPDFPRYLQETQPDFVHVNQWCAVGGFLASVSPTQISDNLICQWQKTAENLTVGDTFQWEGQTITLVAPEVVQINWHP
ncbi:MAG: hypothetical protein AAF614_38935 [Chloroflexota bacterium]